MQASDDMGDARHGKRHPTDPEREITDEWRAVVRAKLEENKRANKAAGISRSAKRPPDDYASLARAIGANKSGMPSLLGELKPPRGGKKPVLAQTSGFHDAIVRVLRVPPSTKAVDPDDELANQLETLSSEERLALSDLLSSPKRSSILMLVRKALKD